MNPAFICLVCKQRKTKSAGRARLRGGGRVCTDCAPDGSPQIDLKPKEPRPRKKPEPTGLAGVKVGVRTPKVTGKDVLP